MTGQTLKVRIKSVTYEAARVNSYRLEPVRGGLLPAFTAGAHITCQLTGALVRSYSVLSDQDHLSGYVIAVRNDLEGRGGSRHIHERWRVGDILTIGAPVNSFPLVEEASHSILIAGGIGITPILSMAVRLRRLGKSWELHYAARSRAEAPFLDRLEALRQEDAGSRVSVACHNAGAPRLDVPAVVSRAGQGAHLYCCGPARMLKAFEEATRCRPRSHVHVERFSATDAPATDGGYEVVLQRSGRIVPIKPGKTILDTLLEEGIEVQFSCTQGVCGSCETAVVSGIPDHRDVFLSAEERAANKTVMICCSGSKTPRLVLDL